LKQFCYERVVVTLFCLSLSFVLSLFAKHVNKEKKREVMKEKRSKKEKKINTQQKGKAVNP
jgi:uncharacterized ion transporter superfamily protein YfcC